MATMNVKPAGDRTGRGPSRDLWNPIRAEEIGYDLNAGWMFEDDFHCLPTAKYLVTDNTPTGAAATFVMGDGEGGIAIATGGGSTVTDTEGVNIQLGGTNGENVKCEANSVVAFEARIMPTIPSAGPDFFLGLSTTDTEIITGSSNASDNHIGFESVTANGVLLFHSERATNRYSATTPGTLVTATWIKLGFVVNGLDWIDIYVNGLLKKGLRISSTPIVNKVPTTEMRLSWQVANGSAATQICDIDWWRLAKVYRPYPQ